MEEELSEVTVTINTIDGSKKAIIKVPQYTTLNILKEKIRLQTGFENTNFKFFEGEDDYCLIDNFIIHNDIVLYAIPIAPIPDKATLKDFIVKVNDGEFPQELINKYGTISEWDVHLITDMSYLFLNMQTFNEEIGNWDVSNVTNMRVMFIGASNFNKNISKWNVSSVINMEAMFQSASNFNQDLSIWDISSVINMEAMFFGAINLNEAYKPIKNKKFKK